MFCKCYFAGLWELAHAAKDVKKKGDTLVEPQLEVQAVYLPAVSYLVESPDGYWASLVARFHQARRHSQGVVELGYVLLQYARLTRQTGFFSLPARTHRAILLIAVKMHMLHITCPCQCFALIVTTLRDLIPAAWRWLQAGGLASVLAGDGLHTVAQRLLDRWGTLDLSQQALISSLSNISLVAVLFSLTCWIVICDLIEGTHYKALGHAALVGEMAPVEEGDENTPGSSSEESSPQEPGAKPSIPAASVRDWKPPFVEGPRSLLWRASTFLQIFSDTAIVGYGALTFYGMIPCLLASWSLLRRGTDFEYIVAVKPE